MKLSLGLEFLLYRVQTVYFGLEPYELYEYVLIGPSGAND